MTQSDPPGPFTAPTIPPIRPPSVTMAPAPSVVLGGVVDASTEPDAMPATAPAASVPAVAAPALPALPASLSNIVPEPVVPERPIQHLRVPAPVIRGTRTTEFWLTSTGSLILLVSTLVLFLHGNISQSAFVTLTGSAGVGAPSLYAILRTVLKVLAPTVVLPHDDLGAGH